MRGQEVIPVQVNEGMTLMESARDFSTKPLMKYLPIVVVVVPVLLVM